MTVEVSAGPEPVTRSLKIDVFAEDGQRQAILDSIRRYRHCCRECYAVILLAQTAGAELVDDAEHGPRLQPNSDAARAILAATMGHDGAAFGYQLRTWVLQHLWPGIMSFVWDSIRRDVTTVWTSRDPEHTRVNRGWLALQGARGVAQFQRRGIGFPRATGRPCLDGHTLSLRWHRDLGTVALDVPRLDGGRYHVWRALRDGEPGWQLGTLWLGEQDGRLHVVISYSRPGQAAAVDPGRVCRAHFGELGEQWLTITGPDGAATFDAISSVEVQAWLAQTAARRGELERRRAACGNPRRPWGHRRGYLAAQDVLSRATQQRERGQADRSHAWSRRIVSRALSWRCGRIELGDFPEHIAGHPWGWARLLEMVRYKAKEHSIEVGRV